MHKYIASIIDVLFVFSFIFIIPAITGRISEAAFESPHIYFYMSLTAAVFYPLSCIAMLHKISTEKVLQDGLKSMSAFYKKRWSFVIKWPLGLMIFAYSTVMGMAVFMGDLVTDDKKASAANGPFDTFLLISVIVIFMAITAYMLIKMTGFDPFGFFKKDENSKELSTGWKIVVYPLLAILFLAYLSMAISLLVCALFYFYCIIWVFMLDLADKDKPFPKFFPDNRPIRVAANLSLLLFTVILAFFFEEMVAWMASMPSELSIGAALNTCFVMTLFYLPFRLFFGLYSGKSRLGWLTFALSVIVVFFQTLQRFGTI